MIEKERGVKWVLQINKCTKIMINCFLKGVCCWREKSNKLFFTNLWFTLYPIENSIIFFLLSKPNITHPLNQCYRFNASLMLETLRGKRMMFIGDSLNRGQYVSLICLLHQLIPQHAKSMETFGSLTVFTAKVGTSYPYLICVCVCVCNSQ